MPINTSITITKSVGAGGKNQKMDVYTVQKQLNMHMNPPRKWLVEDGVCGKKTKGTIRDFQRSVLGFRFPDGRVDPNGKTLRGLNNPASEGKWAGMSMMPADYNPPPNVKEEDELGIPAAVRKNLSPQEQTVLERLYGIIKKNHELKPAKDVLDDMVLNEIQIAKALLAVQGVSQWGIEVLQGLAAARRHGFTVRDIVGLMRNVYLGRYKGVGAHKASDEVIQFLRLFSKSPRLVKALKALGKVAFVVTIVVTFLEAGNHFRKGDIGPGMAEIYGALMSIAIPWAGAMNALQGLLYAYYPGAKSPHVDAMFRVMLALDPIGAGKTYVDSAYTFAKIVIVKVATGKVPRGEVDKLVNRMKASPMRVWTDIGEDMGDWFGKQFGAAMLPLVKWFDL